MAHVDVGGRTVDQEWAKQEGLEPLLQDHRDDTPAFRARGPVISRLCRPWVRSWAYGPVFADGGGAAVRVTRLIPDLDDELCRVLDQVEEVLLTLAEWEADPDAPAVLPEALARRAALGAVQRLHDAISPTQTLLDERGAEIEPRIDGAGAGRILGPDGDYQHRPLRLVRVAAADLDVLSAAAAALGLALALDPHSELADAITAGAEAAGMGYRPPPTPTEVVAGLARVLGVLDLEVTLDTMLLTARLEAAAGADVVLTRSEELAYEQLAARFNGLWAADDGVTPFLY
jgi:hypothetical protein